MPHLNLQHFIGGIAFIPPPRRFIYNSQWVFVRSKGYHWKTNDSKSPSQHLCNVRNERWRVRLTIVIVQVMKQNMNLGSNEKPLLVSRQVWLLLHYPGYVSATAAIPRYSTASWPNLVQLTPEDVQGLAIHNRPFTTIKNRLNNFFKAFSAHTFRMNEEESSDFDFQWWSGRKSQIPW